ncbi:MAG: prolyl oligopeptidase family serine peptidase [Gemmatimonadaceae bacterium]
MLMRLHHALRVVSLACLASVTLQAQTTKKVLTQDTYDIWRTISGSSVSADGRWVAYTLSPVVGDGEVVVRSAEGATEYRAARGWTGRPVMSVTVDSPFVAPAAQFSADSKLVAFLSYAPKADFDRARREKKPAAQQPKASLTMIELAGGKVTTVPRVRSFRLARESARYLVYLLEAEESRDTANTQRPVPGVKKREYGTTLVLRDLNDASETRIADVSSYVVDDTAHVLLYAVTSRTPANDGVYLRSLSNGTTATIMAGEGDYKQMAVDRAGGQLAFLSNRDEFRNEKPRFAAYYATARAPMAQIISAPAQMAGLSASDKGRVEFVRDGSALTFGVAPPPLDSIPADSLADKAVFDLWHWKDSRLQPQQRLEAARDRDRTFLSVYDIKNRRIRQLANDSMPSAQVSDDGRVALQVTPVPYMVESMWGEGGSDVYVTDIATGASTRVADKVDFGATLSPGAHYVLWFQKDHWHAYSLATGKAVDLTGAVKGVRFSNELFDEPDVPPAYGVAGWTRGDRSVLVYDRYDIWELDPAGVRAPRMVTDSAGTRSHIALRVVDLDPEDRFIDPTQPLLLRAFDDSSKASGFYRDHVDGNAPPERLVMANRSFGMPQKARHADRLLLTQQTLSEFPDLWTGNSVSSLTRISNANPQQAEYRWPTVELVSWRSSDNVPLQGLLYKPEDFDPSRQYPMIVYYYERLSDGMYSYQAPTGRNVINPTVYTSLGYLVFFPDIVYELGWPGPSAVKSIIPGVQSLVARGFVNPKAIGLAGQSWGGYQTAYLITQTNMFAAAVPNAPVANMTSAYGGIRWGSGLARAFQYEHTQSRIGGSIWEYPVRYIENSPLFHLDRVTTPVFFMQNDADDAVPWYQGIELFVGLRRLGKEVYFITYNGDVHNPRKRANQKDVDMRMQQFFGNKLKGEAAPEWMIHGIPYLQKGRDQMTPVKAAPTSPTGSRP